jgi:hypothetical protein
MFGKSISPLLLLAVTVVLAGWALPSARGMNIPEDQNPPLPSGSAYTESSAPASHLGSEMLISSHSTMPETERRAPEVDFNYVRGEYLVVWHNKFAAKKDIYARRVSQKGELLSWFAVSDLPNDCLQPAVAFDAANGKYLVVWMYDALDDGEHYEIWGRIIDWNGPGLGSSFRIWGWDHRALWSPRVVLNHNRTHYFVVWNAINTTTHLPNDIAGLRVYPDGTMDPAATILTTSTEPHQVDLAYNWANDEWFIAFVRSFSETPPGTSNDIYGQITSYHPTTGALQPGGLLPIYTGEKHQNAPAVEVDGEGNYMVVFEHEYNASDRDIYAQKLDQDGNKVGGHTAIAISAWDEVSPDLIASFDQTPEYLAVFQRETETGQSIAALRWGPGLELMAFDVSNYGLWASESPAVAGGRGPYLTVYEGYSPGNPTLIRHIYGRLWSPYATFLPLVVRN